MKRFDSDIFMASLRKLLDEPAPASPDIRTLLGLLTLEKEEFLRQAYRLILQREVDPAGLRGYAASANSMPGRIKVVCALLLSPERGKAPLWQIKAKSLAGKVFRSFGRR